jgi:hypothetical protein
VVDESDYVDWAEGDHIGAVAKPRRACDVVGGSQDAQMWPCHDNRATIKSDKLRSQIFLYSNHSLVTRRLHVRMKDV